jgi:hypothetical protein
VGHYHGFCKSGSLSPVTGYRRTICRCHWRSICRNRSSELSGSMPAGMALMDPGGESSSADLAKSITTKSPSTRNVRGRERCTRTGSRPTVSARQAAARRRCSLLLLARVACCSATGFDVRITFPRGLTPADPAADGHDTIIQLAPISYLRSTNKLLINDKNY